jgi:hypothetical protein
MIFIEVVQPDPEKRDLEIVQALRVANHHGLSVHHPRDTKDGIALFCSLTDPITQQDVARLLEELRPRGARRHAASLPRSQARTGR